MVTKKRAAQSSPPASDNSSQNIEVVIIVKGLSQHRYRVEKKDGS